MPTRSEELNTRYQSLVQEIADLARQAGRNPDDVHLLAVSKTYPYSDIAALARCGVRDFAENRPQELEAKLQEESAHPVEEALRWHLIGTLQRNKIKLVLGRVVLIHSVDSLKLLHELNDRAEHLKIRQPILLQLNLAEEESKHGFRGDSIEEAAAAAASAAALDFRGFMTMAPNFENPEDALPVFCACRSIFERWQKKLGQEQINTLSMGMSHDYAQAIRAGATHLRIGSRLFGERNYALS